MLILSSSRCSTGDDLTSPHVSYSCDEYTSLHALLGAALHDESTLENEFSLRLRVPIDRSSIMLILRSGRFELACNVSLSLVRNQGSR